MYRVCDTRHSIPCSEAVPLLAAIFGCNCGELVLDFILGFTGGELVLGPTLGCSCGELDFRAFFGLGCTTGGSLVTSGTVGSVCCGKSGDREDDLGGGGGIGLVAGVLSPFGASVESVDGGFSPG